MVSLSSSSTLLATAVITMLSNAAHAVEFFAPDWIIPLEIGTRYPTVTVNTGDALTFSWSQGTHDVWIYPSGSCNPTGAIQVGTIQDNPTTYVFGTQDSGTTITFACDVGAHCDSGMIMDVNVLAIADGGDETAPLIDTNDPEPVSQEPTEDVATDIGEFGTCYVCGEEGVEVTEPNVIISLPNPGFPPFDVSCAQLYQDGLDGIIPSQSCNFISQVAAIPCGCTSTDFSCNICGDEGDFVVRSPDTMVTLPIDPGNPISCADLSAKGLNGELSPTQCGTATLFAFVPCQCAPPTFSCSICGEGFKISDSDAEIEFPDLEGTYTCGQLEVLGANGELSPANCVAAETLNRVSNVCGCVPTEDYTECNICGSEDLLPMTPNSNISISRFEFNTCQYYVEAGKNGELTPGACAAAQSQAQGFMGCNCAPVDFTCNVCGGDGTNITMLNPENNFTVAEVGAFVNCGELDAAGVDGIITPNDCAVISPLVQAQCSCAPVGYTCNICGEDSGQFITEGTTTFVPGEDTTCAQAQAAGLAGEIDPLRCSVISPFAQLSCGCAGSGTMAPSVADEVEEEVVEVLSTDAPSVTAVTPDNEPEEPVATSTINTPPATPDETPIAAPVDAPVPMVNTTEMTTTDTSTIDGTDTNAADSNPTDTETTDTNTTDAGVAQIPVEAPVEDSETDGAPDLSSETGVVTSLEGSTSEANSASVKISPSMSMVLSCLMGMIVTLFV